MRFAGRGFTVPHFGVFFCFGRPSGGQTLIRATLRCAHTSVCNGMVNRFIHARFERLLCAVLHEFIWASEEMLKNPQYQKKCLRGIEGMFTPPPFSFWVYI